MNTAATKRLVVYKGFFDEANTPTRRENLLVLSKKSPRYIKGDFYFDPNDVEMFDSDGQDFTKALKHFAKRFEPYAVQQIDTSSSPTHTPHQQLWKVWLEPAFPSEKVQPTLVEVSGQEAPFDYLEFS